MKTSACGRVLSGIQGRAQPVSGCQQAGGDRLRKLAGAVDRIAAMLP